MAKLKFKKQAKGKPGKRSFPWLWVTIALFVAVFITVFQFTSPSLTPLESQKLKAAIIDQLYTNYPNEDFTTKITQDLQDYGFEVNLHRGDAITVDFYRNLPSYGYKFILFRAHSGAVGANPQDVQSVVGTYLFTNEPYSTIKYAKEQLRDELAKARVAEGYPYVFAIGPKFIIDSVIGNFDNTVVVIDGCSCLYNNDLAQAFTQKGASCYLAWDASVDLDYVDEATIALIKNLCCERFTVKKAVDLTMATKGPDPKYHAVLGYYPLGRANKTLKELISSPADLPDR